MASTASFENRFVQFSVFNFFFNSYTLHFSSFYSSNQNTRNFVNFFNFNEFLMRNIRLLFYEEIIDTFRTT